MKTTTVQPLTTAAFAPYGQFANMLAPSGPAIGTAPIAFFRDMQPMRQPVGVTPSFSICQVTPRPLIIDTIEYHTATQEGILPLDGDVLMHVAPATANGVLPETMDVFFIPQGTFIALNPGVWHHAVYAAGTTQVNTVIVLPERTYANDCTVVELTGDDRWEIKQ